MFLRKKTVKGHEYWYLVKSVWVKGRPRQKVVRYLGRRDAFDLADVVRIIEADKKRRSK